MALSNLMQPDLLASSDAASSLANAPGVSGFPQFAPKVRRVIYLYMSGGPSQFETFDYKPKLAEMDGKPMPESITAGQPIAQLQGQAQHCSARRMMGTRLGGRASGIHTILAVR